MARKKGVNNKKKEKKRQKIYLFLEGEENCSEHLYLKKYYKSFETRAIDVDFYFGVDRTLGSDEAVIFSPERGTVIETTYLVDSSQNITNLTVIGENNVILQAERERQEKAKEE